MTNCPECESPLQETRSGGGFCARCKESFSAEQIGASGQFSGNEAYLRNVVGVLPHPLALLLKDYLDEKNLHLKLHRMCDAAEMATRFLAAICFAEIERANGIRRAGSKLRDAIFKGIERPSFGIWVRLLCEAVAELPRGADLVLPQTKVAVDALLKIVSPPEETRETALSTLRNDLSHQRFSNQQAQTSLDEHGHQERFERYWMECAGPLFGSLQLVGFSHAGEAFLLRGVPAPREHFAHFRRTHLTEQALSWCSGAIILTREGTSNWIELTPLQTFGPALRQHTDGAGSPSVVLPEDVPQVYSRRKDERLQYTVLHDKIGAGDGTEALQSRFNELFPLSAWGEEIKAAANAEFEKRVTKEVKERFGREADRFSFRDIVVSEGGIMVGRDSDFERVFSWLDVRTTGVGVILGQPGMGKTAFAVRLSQLRGRKKSWLCFRHFFKVADSRCSVRDFIRGIMLQFATNGFETDALRTDLDGRELREEFLKALASFAASYIGEGKRWQRLILLLDGLDELAQSDPSIFELIKRKQLPGVIWVITARPETAVKQALAQSDHIEWLFGEEGLQSLNRDAVRTLLMEELDRCRYSILEEEEGRNSFLDQLTTKARSLPLYLHLLLDELSQEKGQQYIDHPDRLPKELIAYYARLVDELSLDPARKFLPDIIALLAIAKTPLPERMLSSLLEDDLRKHPEWGAIFQRSLRLGHVLMRRGYVWEGISGLTLYHQSFGDYLLENEHKCYEDFRMAPVVQIARERVNRLCLAWENWPEESYERAYAFRYGVQHLLEDRRWADVEALLTDLPFLERRIAAGEAFALADDFALAVSRLPPARPQRRILGLLEEALRRDIHFIARHSEDYPQALFQCLWNSCWWYDCPNSVEHYVTAPEEPLGGQTLYALLERWRSTRDAGLTPSPWMRSLRPLPLRLGGPQLWQFPGHGVFYNHVAVSPDGLLIATGGYDTSLRVWNATTGEQVSTFDKHTLPIQAVSFVANGTLVASGSSESIRFWNPTTGCEEFALPPVERSMGAFAFSEDGFRVAFELSGGPFRICDLQTGVVVEIDDTAYGYSALCFSPDGNWVASASLRRVMLWNTATEECIQLGSKGASSVSFSADGQLIVVGSAPYATIWDICSGRPPQELIGDEHHVTDTAFSRDGSLVVTGSFDGSVRVWETNTSEQKILLPGHGYSVDSVAFHPDGRRVVSGSADGTIRVWDIAKATQLPTLHGNHRSIRPLAFAPSGRRLVATDDANSVCVWNAENGRELLVFQGHGSKINTADFSPDAKRIATGAADASVCIWETETGERVLSFSEHKKAVRSLAFSPSGRLIASSSEGSDIRLWNAATGRQMLVLRGDADHIAFSHDELMLLGRDVNSLCVWHLKSGTQVFTLRSDEIANVSFFAQEEAIIVEFDCGKVQLWDIRNGCRINGRTASTNILARTEALDSTRILKGTNSTPIAILSIPLLNPIMHPQTLTVAGIFGKYLGIFVIEDGGGDDIHRSPGANPRAT